MSNPRPPNYDKSEITGSTIGFIFHANHEELEEVQSKQDSGADENIEDKTDIVSSENLEGAKAALGNNLVIEGARDQKNLLGKRSISVDSAYESPFSNPIETWKKLNVLKEKITKTVEGKILEMKIDRNVLSKSNRSRLIHSKENSSVSDSEDTSESSKISEQWKDADNQNFLTDQVSNEYVETHLNNSDSETLESETKKTDIKESENELRNRKSFINFPEIINLSDIKIATAKSDIDGRNSNFTEDVESGVEADENLDATEDESVEFFDGETLGIAGDSQNPPSGGNNAFLNFLTFFTSEILPLKNTVVFLLGFTMYYFFPLSEFIRGFLLSLLLVLFWGAAKSYVQYDETSQKQKPFVVPDYKSMPPLKVPQSKPVKGIWFNEYEKEVYDPDFYSVTQTVPAYLELDDSLLKISRPKGKICRRATYDEPEYKLQFISQRIYNISGCNIYLMPDGLTRKRLFSKKYPIVIFLRPDSLISEKKNGKEVEEKESHESAETESTSLIGITTESPKNKGALYLFARCDRQKEEWYRRLLAATRISNSLDCPKNEQISEAVEDVDNEAGKIPLDDSFNKEPCTPFENIFFDDDEAQLEEYMRYMAKFVDVDGTHHEVKVKSQNSWYGKLKLKKKDVHSQEDVLVHSSSKNSYVGPVNKKMRVSGTYSMSSEGSEEKKQEGSDLSNQVQWLSAFVNRILFDVFRSPYWLSRIRNKIQRKLNSIRLPYYIEDIEVIEMDLGKTGPMFHRISQPYLDERGLWFDTDLTFDGLIKLTIQTHLNLVKLQKGIDENEEGETQTAGKPKKGKKKQRIESESKDSFLIKDSNENSKEFVSLRNKIITKRSTKLCPFNVEKENSSSEIFKETPKVDCKPSEECGCNHCNLIEEVAQLAKIAAEEILCENKERSPIYDSELEDSAESSDEDEEEEGRPSPQPTELEEPHSEINPSRYPKTRRSSRKIFKVFENVAQSKYFRSVAQSKYVQKAIAGVSATKLRLTLEIKSCTGTLAVNIPPPPSDRFWYGFREMPTLVFSANPKIGDKAVRFAHINNFLQKKILHELKAKIVLPNMICTLCPALVREEMSSAFVNVPRFPKIFGKKVMVSPNMIDFVLPTSAPTQSSSFLQFEEPDLQEAALSE